MIKQVTLRIKAESDDEAKDNYNIAADWFILQEDKG